MLEIGFAPGGEVFIKGRLDAAQAGAAQDFLDQVDQAVVLDLAQLEYISSAGLGVLLKTLKRLMACGHGMKLVNVNNHINDILHYSGFDKLFEIEATDA